MPRLFLLAAVALAAAALVVPAASAYPLGPDGITPAWMDTSPSIVPTILRDDPPPVEPPAAASCPSTPSSLDPIAECPFDPTTYGQWPGDDADAPLWTRCNFDSGWPDDPCPHSRVGDSTWYFQCDAGNPDPDTAGKVGVEFGGPETDEQWRADVTDNCSGPWRSLSLA